MTRTLLAGACLIVALVPAPAHAWGFAAHQMIMRGAIELLPPEVKPFFDAKKDEIVLRVVDPDLWRNVGWDEDPNHFIDFGVREYGASPFTALPRSYDAALEKFGIAVLRRNGLLPWRTAEMFGYLRRAFEEFPRNAPYTISNTVLYSATLSHYVQDAHQPLHATDNYDGAKTGNHGIHARFERDLFERFSARIRVSPKPPVPITNARDGAFDILVASFQLVDPILQADREAITGKDTYDDEYFERFFVKVQPILERSLSDAVSATAGLLIGAWQEAGRPTLRVGDARPPQKVRDAR
jgi:hypothetical protein